MQQLHLGTVATIPIKFIPSADTTVGAGIPVPNLSVVNSRCCLYGLNQYWVAIQSQAGSTKVLQAKFVGCYIDKTPGVTYTLPIFAHFASGGSGDVVFDVTACSTTENSSGGSFTQIATDNASRFQCNYGAGYTFTLAGEVNTVWRNNVNFSGNTHKFHEQLKLQNSTATATAGAATLNKQSGIITSESLTTAAGATYTLTLTNSLISATSLVMAHVTNGTNSTGKITGAARATPGSGSATIVIYNEHASAAFNGTLKIHFVVLNP